MMYSGDEWRSSDGHISSDKRPQGALMQITASSSRRLTICGLTELGAFQNAAVTHVLSILDPGYPEPADFAAYGPHKRLTLRFDDIIDPAPGMALPESHHVEALLEFGKGLAATVDDPL